MSEGPVERINWSEGFRVRVGPYTLGLAEASPETAGYWEGVDRDELRVKRCACGQHLHPRRIVCSECGSLDLEWQTVSGDGEIYTFSELRRAPRPEFVGAIPYYLGIVRLQEGVHLFTRLIPQEGSGVAIGARVGVDFRVLENGVKLPVFHVLAA